MEGEDESYRKEVGVVNTVGICRTLWNWREFAVLAPCCVTSLGNGCFLAGCQGFFGGKWFSIRFTLDLMGLRVDKQDLCIGPLRN